MRRFLTIATLVALAAFDSSALKSTSLAAEPAKLEVTATKPPDEVAEPIRAVLSERALRLTSGDKPFFEFWFRKELPLDKKSPGGTLELDTMREGTVLGALRVHQQRRDFRNEELPPGVYVIRLGIQPEDGNHQGVAPTRTFALLIPAKQDTKLDAVPHKDLVKSAATINAAKHPSNFNLQPVEKTDGEFPRLAENNDGEHKLVLLQLPARVGNAGEKSTLTFALVYEGTGHI